MVSLIIFYRIEPYPVLLIFIILVFFWLGRQKLFNPFKDILSNTKDILILWNNIILQRDGTYLLLRKFRSGTYTDKDITDFLNKLNTSDKTRAP
jgi:hypothetical protein